TDYLKTEDPQQAAMDALNKVMEDTKNAIKAEADQELNRWLDDTAGQAAIAAATPPPCGTGRIEIDRETMKDPLSDIVTYLTRFSIDLGDGELVINLEAKGSLPVCGDYTVKQSGQITMAATPDGRLMSAAGLQNPSVDISPDPLCQAALSLLLNFFDG